MSHAQKPAEKSSEKTTKRHIEKSKVQFEKSEVHLEKSEVHKRHKVQCVILLMNRPALEYN